jgi:hypothetical protein
VSRGLALSLTYKEEKRKRKRGTWPIKEQQSPESGPEGAETPWASAFDALGERIGRYVVRQEPRERMRTYLRVLLSPVERKNGWQVAEEAGEATPYAMQHLLDRAKWDADGVRDELRSYVSETLGDGAAVLVIDETGGSRRKAANRWECNDSTVARPGGSRTARWESF